MSVSMSMSMSRLLDDIMRARILVFALTVSACHLSDPSEDDDLASPSPSENPGVSLEPSPQPATLVPGIESTEVESPEARTPQAQTPERSTTVPETSPSLTPTAATPLPPSPTRVAYCPTGMGGLYVNGDLIFCVDLYEVTVSGELGTHDQYMEGAIPTTAVAQSEKGVIPSTYVTYGQADMACRNTPVITKEGRQQGGKRLVTTWVWETLCDGVLGDGGQLYPYGDTFDENACVTLDAEGNQVYSSLQPTGSLETCVSPFGLMDMTGNAWEWADTEMRLDTEAFFALAFAEGRDLHPDEAGLLFTSDLEVADHLFMQMMGLQSISPTVDPLGYLVLPAGTLPPYEDEIGRGPRAFLLQADNDPVGVQDCEECYLGVELLFDPSGDLNSDIYLKVSYESEGEPIPDKRGGAFYTVIAPSCSIYQRVHFHDTDGLISFRCMSDPLLEVDEP